MVEFEAFFRRKILSDGCYGAENKAKKDSKNEQGGSAFEARGYGDDAGGGNRSAGKGGSCDCEAARCRGSQAAAYSAGGKRSSQGSSGADSKDVRVCQRIAENSLHLCTRNSQATTGQNGAEKTWKADLKQDLSGHFIVRIQQILYSNADTPDKQIRYRQNACQQYQPG